MTRLSDLPVDIFLLICNDLDVTSFVNLTSTCKSLYANFSEESTVWSRLIRSTFRIANQPVVEHDGARWKKLYRKLKTQTHAYTWGSNGSGCLGQSARLRAHTQRGLRPPVVSWPEEIENTEDIGIISEMQCGGWSTSLLNSKGVLRIYGVLNGMEYQMPPQHGYTILHFPAGFTTNHTTYDPVTAIKQFSHGRCHILGLSDSGRIWSWNNASSAAYHVKFLHHTTTERQTTGGGTVEKVVAGWSSSAALVQGSGIIVWAPLERARGEHTDTMLVTDTEVVFGTDRPDDPVINFVVLESSIVYITKAGRLFISWLAWESQQRLSEPCEILLPDKDGKIIDLQGSFRSLAIFTTTGAVLFSTEQQLQESTFSRIPALQNSQVIAVAFGDYHFHALHAPGYITSYGKEPQSCGAFGLGANTPEARLRGIRQRGMMNIQHRPGGDGHLVPHAYVQGRRVWFEREKREWIKFLASGGAHPEEAVERMRMALGSPEVASQGEVSEWVEQEGRDWEDKYGVRSTHDAGLPAYFALNVTAAGWHSGALVLVDDELASALKNAVEIPDAEEAEEHKIEAESLGLVAGWVTWAYDLGRWFLGTPQTQTSAGPEIDNSAQRVLSDRDPTAYGAAPRAGFHYAWHKQHFPRLQLVDGTEMPGEVPFDTWRYGRPDWSRLPDSDIP